ncbi:MAG TPA: hypothetical protein VGC40_05675 [Paenirhodobacter sp.]
MPGRMLGVILSLLCIGPALALCAGFASADPRPHGLMWNHSGQALTLPLQILTDPGADLYLTLVPVDGALTEPVLAAYIRGGAPFRLLVPPGRFQVRVVAGADWQGEDRLFGADTRRVDLPRALVFEVQGAGRRSGHLVDLRGGAVRVRDYGLCRGGATTTVPDAHRVAPVDAPPLATPKTLATPRCAETRLPPPDQPQIYSDDPRDRPFAQPFPRPARVPIPRVGAAPTVGSSVGPTATAVPAPGPVHVRPAQTRARSASRWTVCE